MLIRGGAALKPEEQKLLKLFRALDRVKQQSATSFMEFLLSQGGGVAENKPLQPDNIPRPDKESVVKAIKRMRATYHMLDQNKLFNETSQHMTSHLLHGKSATDVIDELEIMFARHYQLYLEEMGENVPEPVHGTSGKD
ncbi:MAG: hypothetical protein K8H84_13580 [Sulfuricella denitrificans]|nr:hypothetical protein [Sulfuricella denitrificans]